MTGGKNVRTPAHQPSRPSVSRGNEY